MAAITKWAYNEQILITRIFSYALHAKNRSYNECGYNGCLNNVITSSKNMF